MTDERCPKCSHKRSSVSPDACARCGLVFSMWDPSTAPKVVVLDEAAETLWTAAVGDWNNMGVHDAFLKYCSVAGLLAAAGRRYRERLDEIPNDAMAAQMQKRVLAMATALLGAPTQKPTAPVTRSAGFWMIVVGSLIVGILAATMFGRR